MAAVVISIQHAHFRPMWSDRQLQQLRRRG